MNWSRSLLNWSRSLGLIRSLLDGSRGVVSLNSRSTGVVDENPLVLGRSSDSLDRSGAMNTSISASGVGVRIQKESISGTSSSAKISHKDVLEVPQGDLIVSVGVVGVHELKTLGWGWRVVDIQTAVQIGDELSGFLGVNEPGVVGIVLLEHFSGKDSGAVVLESPLLGVWNEGDWSGWLDSVSGLGVSGCGVSWWSVGWLAGGSGVRLLVTLWWLLVLWLRLVGSLWLLGVLRSRGVGHCCCCRLLLFEFSIFKFLWCGGL